MTLQRRWSGPPRPYRWTREEYYRLDEAGLLEGQHVELIEGQVMNMPPSSAAHTAALILTRQALAQTFAEGYTLRTGAPLDLNDYSQPEPDVAVVTGQPRDYLTAHPSTALLLVEITEGSPKYERTTKLRLYAAATIAEYWIVNLPDRCLEVYRDPTPTGYTTRQVFAATDTVAPLARPDTPVAVADLLP